MNLAHVACGRLDVYYEVSWWTLALHVVSRGETWFGLAMSSPCLRVAAYPVKLLETLVPSMTPVCMWHRMGMAGRGMSQPARSSSR
jgi:hypothetical protein